ncbi:hypothetical protein SASPL_133417 [Salvia splendens]|uniref:Crooked neck n=1 Tax=Salvia splendens TaxID=180675 RepID=A0A8X8ZIE2_SALSN|nr:hypothetical protein SASPL_133417 [Salvia splendens]
MASSREADPNLGYLTKKETEVKLPRPIRVKNKTPASIEITAEQILREARERQESVCVKYAKWEESQKDFKRSRSVWERALKVGYRDHTLWLKYADFEMKNKFINHARNVWDRATQLLPRVDQLWYKYIHMEEVLGNVAAARQIFERWMKT